MADMTLVDGNQPMYASPDLLPDGILQMESEDLSQIPLPRFVDSKDVRLDPMSQSSQHPSVLQQELLKLQQQQILWMKLQQRQMLSQQVQELQGQLLSQLYPTQTLGHDGGYPMAYSSPYLQSPQTSMGSWYETQMEAQTRGTTPKVEPKVPKTTRNTARNTVPNKSQGGSQGGSKDVAQNQKMVRLPKANLNKTDDKNKGVSTEGMIFIGFDGPRCKGPRSFPAKQETGSK